MQFNRDDVGRFAQWSRDVNPLHVDPAFAKETFFGQPIVHGVLSVLRALSSAQPPTGRPLAAIDVEFRGAVVPGKDYDARSTPGRDGFSVAVEGPDGLVLNISASTAPPQSPAAAPRTWNGARPHNEVRGEPAVRSTEDFERGLDVAGIYKTPAPADGDVHRGRLLPSEAQMLALCSYVVGMEIPGLRSLFTRLTLEFHNHPAEAPELWFRARTTKFDRTFRILDIHLDIATPDGRIVATGAIRSYAPFGQLSGDVTELAAHTESLGEGFAGTVALVTGGSRGLGADIAATLSLAGSHVYVAARGTSAVSARLAKELTDRSCRIEFLTGDVSDAAWCKEIVEGLRSRHGRLDLLVLNAGTPPTVLRLSPDTAAEREAYVRHNLRLTASPLAAALPLLNDSQGAVVLVSSSFVTDPPAGFSHYISAKQAGEALVQSARREWPRISGLVARPPRLQTSWNDTPTGVAGAIPPGWAAIHIVRRVSEARGSGAVDLLSEFPPIQRATPTEAASQKKPFPVRLAASFTVDPLLPGLRFWLTQLGVGSAVELAPYAQVLQSLLDPSSLFAGKGGLNVVLLRVRDWLRELPVQQAASREFLRQYLPKMADELVGAFRVHRSRATSETLLLLCPSNAITSSAEDVLIRQTEADILAGVSGLPGLQAVSASSFHNAYRVDEESLRDDLREKIAHIPYRDAYCHVLATIVARSINRRVSQVRKVVVVDCDNTLWSGVVGEVGAEGVELHAHHLALQDTLTRLTQAGLLICLCSKNEEADVWQVFDTRADMRLRRQDIVAAAVNWQAKSQNLRLLADRLNLGLDSFVFLDDNPVECAEVRSRCPEVLTLQWPTDTERALRLLAHTWELDGGQGTKEDARRAQMYREEFRRQEARQGTQAFGDFIKALELVVDISALAPDDLRRASQLTLRTNQFNFTTKRRDEGEIQILAADGSREVRTVRVRDRFGDYGLVGLVVTERQPDHMDIDTFLLSCRVLGRGVEHRIAAELGRMAQAQGADTVRMRVETTRRNTPARRFLESIAASGHGRGDEAGFECTFTADALAGLEFTPADAGGVVEEEAEGPGSTQATAAEAFDADSLRRREEQIARTAFDWADLEGLANAVESGAGYKTAPLPAAHDIAESVYEAFAKALGLSADRVKAVDGLEALSCDSLKIVEITVSLLERFPWLPSTLLFEHRSVSAILQEIDALSRARQRPASVVLDRAAPEVASGRQPSSDIAVVGMDVRCAGANSPEELWQLLSSGRSAVRPVDPARRHFLRPLTDARPHWAGLLADPGGFDAEFFGISPREAEFVDPQLRVFLEVAWGALEDAGATGTSQDVDTGVFVGVMYADYGAPANEGAKALGGPYRCWEGFSLANRLSQLLDFRGPSLAVDTACSSSGTALHLAVRALHDGDCRVAVVGGVNLILDPDRFGSLGRLGILSSRGACEPFGADADGTVLGEGAGAVVLRPLADALASGDRIYGVIKGTGVSTGNGTVGFTAPNPQAQAMAIRRSLSTAKVDPRTVSYVETHGTGTALGDPIEVRGLSLAYGTEELTDPSLQLTHRCRIGSIKPNIGHLEAGAGIVGLIKALLQLHRRTLLPSLTSPQPSPHIPFGQIPFDVQRELEPWVAPTAVLDGQPFQLPRRAGVSSFGVGGANAHVVVEEAPDAVASASAGADRPQHVLTLSAASVDGLRRRAAALHSLAATNLALPAADLCFSSNVGRRQFDHRAAIVASDRESLVAALARARDGQQAPEVITGHSRPDEAPTIAFLFTGQGSQYAGMGRAFYEDHPVFREALDRCAAILDPLIGQSLTELLFSDEAGPEGAQLTQTGFTQPTIFAFQYALAELWRSWGITPSLVMGHSVGEIAALCVAGGLSLGDALTLIAARGRLMQALPSGGTMVSVGADEERVLEEISGSLDLVAIAAVNAPRQTVISGAGAAVAEIVSRLESSGIKTKPLVVSHAFHSPLMQPMLAEYEAVVRSLRFSPPAIPFVSCVAGRFVDGEVTRPEYWLRQVTDPVRFASGIDAALAHGIDSFVEIGPHPVLLGMARESAGDRGARLAWLPSLRRNADPWTTILTSVAGLFVKGAPVDWRAFDAPFARQRVSLPGHAFNRKQYWIQPAPVARTPAPTPSAVTRPVTDLFYELQWRPLPAPAASPARSPRHFVVLSELDCPLAQTLEGQPGRVPGDRVTRVVTGDRFQREGEGAYSVNPLDESSLVQLCRALAEDVSLPMTFVHALGTDAPGNDALTATGLKATHTRLVCSAVLLVRAVATSGARAAVWFLTRGAVDTGVSQTSAIALAQAPLWGLARTIALEHPDVWGGAIDLSAETDAGWEHAAFELYGDGPGRDDQIAFRSRQRYVARLVRRPSRTATPVSLSPRGTYLVSGGTGVLGVHAATWLVASGARHVVLASRRGRVDKDGEAACALLRATGATITLVAADVGHEPDVARLLRDIAATNYPLRGVMHLAGVDAPSPISGLTTEAIWDTLAPKALGAWLLHQHTQGLELDFFVGYSSVASVLGAIGRGHYAAANTFLDALVSERRRAGLASTSISWGPWAGGGMASAEHLAQFERIGNHGLDPAACRRALDALVTTEGTSVAVADIDWEVFRPVYEARGAKPLLSEIRLTTDSAKPETAPTVGWPQELLALPASDRLARITALLRLEVATTLGFDDADEMALDRTFFDAGMDSLMMAELVSRLRQRLGAPVSNLVFDHPTVHALAPRLLELVGAPEPSGSASPEPSGTEPLQLARYRTESWASFEAFSHEVFPDREPSRLKSRFDWAFLESAARVNVQPSVWLATDNAQVVGMTAAIPVRVRVGDTERPTAWFVDTAVRDEYQRLAVGPRLLMQAHEDFPIALSLGQSEEMRQIQYRLGWQRVGPLQTAQLLLRPERVLSGKLPAPVAWAAGIGLRATSAVRDLVQSRPMGSVAEITRFGPEHDCVWAAMAASLDCAVVRDASYLNWKYVDRPSGQSFVRLEVQDAGVARAIAVLLIRHPDEIYRYRRAFLVDLVVPPSDERLVSAAIQAACLAAGELEADSVTCHFVGPWLGRALRRQGFFLATPERHLLVRPGHLEGQERSLFTSETRWFVTMGDSDIDRPSS